MKMLNKKLVRTLSCAAVAVCAAAMLSVGAFAAEEISHLGIAFGFTVTECIDSFHWLIGNILVKLIDLFSVVVGSPVSLVLLPLRAMPFCKVSGFCLNMQ